LAWAIAAVALLMGIAVLLPDRPRFEEAPARCQPADDARPDCVPLLVEERPGSRDTEPAIPYVQRFALLATIGQ
jgi:hypothetical protein